MDVNIDIFRINKPQDFDDSLSKLEFKVMGSDQNSNSIDLNSKELERRNRKLEQDIRDKELLIDKISGLSENLMEQDKSRNINSISDDKFKNINENFITFRKPSKYKVKELNKCIPLSNSFND